MPYPQPSLHQSKDTSPGLGPVVSTFRGRPFRKKDALFLSLLGILAIFLPSGYGIWSAIRAYAQYGPAAALRWSQLWFFLAGGALVVSLALILSRIRQSRPFAAVHENGLRFSAARSRAGLLRVHALPWVAISGIQTEFIQESFLGIKTRRIQRIKIIPKEGRPLYLWDGLHNSPELVNQVKNHLYPALRDQYSQRYQAGDWVDFGPVSIQQKGIRLGKHPLPWGRVQRVGVHQGYLLVTLKDAKGKKRSTRTPLAKIINPELLFEFIKKRVNA